MSFIDPWFIPEPTAPVDVLATGTIDNQPTVDNSSNAVSVLRFTGVAPTLNGLAPAPTPNGTNVRPSQRIHLMAIGGPLILANETASSLAANRIVTGTGANVTIQQGAATWLVYDMTSQRWRVSHGGGGGGGGGTTPTGTGLRKVVSGVETATASLLVNADVANTAAIATTKIANGSDGQVLQTISGSTVWSTSVVLGASGFLALGTTPAASGDFRIPYAGASTRNILVVKNSTATDTPIIRTGAGDACTFGNSALDMNLAGITLTSSFTTVQSTALGTATFNSAGVMYLGTTSTFQATTQASAVNVYAATTGQVALGLGGSTKIYINGAATGNVEFWAGAMGSEQASTAFKWAAATIAGANGTVVATAAQYSRPKLVLAAGTATAAWTLQLPAVDGNEWTIINTSGFQVTVRGPGGSVFVVMPNTTCSKVVCYDGTNFIKCT